RTPKTRRYSDSVRADRLARRRHSDYSRTWPRIGSARCGGISRHGQHHSRSHSGPDQAGPHARADQSNVPNPRLHAPVRFRCRGLDNEPIRRSGLSWPCSKRPMKIAAASLQRVLVIATLGAALSLLAEPHAAAQNRGAPPAAVTAKTSAPIDLTGYW